MFFVFIDFWIFRESSLFAGNGGGLIELSSIGGAGLEDFVVWRQGREEEEGEEVSVGDFIDMLDFRIGGGGGVPLGDLSLLSFSSKMHFLAETKLTELPLPVEEEMEDEQSCGGVGGLSSRSGVGFLAGDCGGGVGEVIVSLLSLLQLVCGCSGSSFSAGVRGQST